MDLFRPIEIGCVELVLPAPAPLALYAEFARRHPAGSIVEATVVAGDWRCVTLELEPRIRAKLSVSDSAVRTGPNAGLPHLGERVEVLVRRIDLKRCRVRVYRFDPRSEPKYCMAEAGYRSRHDAIADHHEQKARRIAQHLAAPYRSRDAKPA